MDKPKPPVTLIRIPSELHLQCKEQAARERIDLATWYARGIATLLRDVDTNDMRTAP
jgi:uracil DNA glycosylase